MKPNAVQELVLLGTAFAVTPNKLLTAYHVFFDEDIGAELVGQIVICRKIAKNADAYVMDAPIAVKLAELDVAADFAFLDLDDVAVKSFDSYIPLSLEANLPDASIEGEELKSYHAPIGQFVTNAFVDMTIWSGPYERVLQYDRGGKIILVDVGLYRGACGAPYVNHSGHVVAMHLSSMHEVKNFSLVKKRKRSARKSSATSSQLGDVIDSVTDMADVHASIREGLVLCRQPLILQTILGSA